VVKGPGHKADHSCPSSAEVKKVYSYTSTPPYVFMAWHSVKLSTGTTLPFTSTYRSTHEKWQHWMVKFVSNTANMMPDPKDFPQSTCKLLHALCQLSKNLSIHYTSNGNTSTSQTVYTSNQDEESWGNMAIRIWHDIHLCYGDRSGENFLDAPSLVQSQRSCFRFLVFNLWSMPPRVREEAQEAFWTKISSA